MSDTFALSSARLCCSLERVCAASYVLSTVCVSGVSSHIVPCPLLKDAERTTLLHPIMSELAGASGNSASIFCLDAAHALWAMRFVSRCLSCSLGHALCLPVPLAPAACSARAATPHHGTAHCHAMPHQRRRARSQHFVVGHSAGGLAAGAACLRDTQWDWGPLVCLRTYAEEHRSGGQWMAFTIGYCLSTGGGGGVLFILRHWLRLAARAFTLFLKTLLSELPACFLHLRIRFSRCAVACWRACWRACCAPQLPVQQSQKAPSCRNQACPSAAVGLRAQCTAATRVSCCDGRVRASVVARMLLRNMMGSFAVLMSVKVDRGRASSDATTTAACAQLLKPRCVACVMASPRVVRVARCLTSRSGPPEKRAGERLLPSRSDSTRKGTHHVVKRPDQAGIRVGGLCCARQRMD